MGQGLDDLVVITQSNFVLRYNTKRQLKAWFVAWLGKYISDFNNYKEQMDLWQNSLAKILTVVKNKI